MAIIHFHHTDVETGIPKLNILINAFLGISAFVLSFAIPSIVEIFAPSALFIIPATILGLSPADWVIKILQAGALIFSIRASKIAIKRAEEKKGN